MTSERHPVISDSHLKTLTCIEMGLDWLKTVQSRYQGMGSDFQSDSSLTTDNITIKKVGCRHE